MSCDNSKADIPIGIFMCSFIGLIMGGLAGWFVNSFIIYIFVILTESILKIDVLAIFAGGTFGGLAGGFLGAKSTTGKYV